MILDDVDTQCDYYYCLFEYDGDVVHVLFVWFPAGEHDDVCEDQTDQDEGGGCLFVETDEN